MNINNLPQSVQDDIRSRLCAFSEVTVWQNANGEYDVRACIILGNGQSDKYIGEYTAKEVFTVEEQIVNYVNEFRDYPFDPDYKYTGKHDWKALQSDWTQAEMVEGNIVFN